MGQSETKERLTEPPSFERAHPEFEHFIEISQGFWHLTADFKVLGGIVNLKTHMSVCSLSDGTFVAIDAVTLEAPAKRELDVLTDSGDRLVAVLQTHPFHTIHIPWFHQHYGASRARRWFGCPRHLRKFEHIKWAGDLNSTCARNTFEPDLAMDVPAGSVFVDPKPPDKNHFSSVLVLHRRSKVLHSNDTLMFFDRPGRLLSWFTAYRDQTMHFHASLLGPGLHPTAEAPEQFKRWFSDLLDSWEFEHLAAAHTGCCFGRAKQLSRELLARTVPKLDALAKRNANKLPVADTDRWADGPDNPECG